MTYEEAVCYIHSIPKFNRVLGNDRLRQLLRRMDNPQNKLRFLHVAGTNGKGSAAAMLAKILQEAGYRVGLFTSPYIEVFNERIQINGENIKNQELARLVEEVKGHVDGMSEGPSEFAFVTACALLYFYRHVCDFVVLEVGMGGALDATNVIEESDVSMLMRIGYDHMEYLGDTLSEIAQTKCGIIKEGGTVVSYPQAVEAMQVIRTVCEKRHARLIVADKPQRGSDGTFCYNGSTYRLKLRGSWQADNAAVVLETVGALRQKGVEIPERAVSKGLESVTWPARFEVISQNPMVILDGAHNQDGIEELAKSLKALGRRIILVMAMMKDKTYKECVQNIAPVCRCLIATQIDMPRCEQAEKLARIAEGECDVLVCTNPVEAVKMACGMANRETAVCVCGSLYLAGEVRRYYKN